MAALAVLRELDRERYLAALFAPADRREAMAALSAYHAELARIPLLVREPMAGEIRLQWWREVISGDRAGEAAGHPLAPALLGAISAHDLPVPVLDRMADARLFDLYHDPMPDMAALEGHFGETHAALIQCQCLVLDAKAAAGAATASGHAGMVTGLAALLAGLPRQMARGQWSIPADMIAAAGTSREALAAGDGAARGRVIALLTALAGDHLARCRAELARLPRAIACAFLPVAAAGIGVARAAAAGPAAFERVAAPSPLRLQWAVVRAAMAGL